MRRQGGDEPPPPGREVADPGRRRRVGAHRGRCLARAAFGRVQRHLHQDRAQRLHRGRADPRPLHRARGRRDHGQPDRHADRVARHGHVRGRQRGDMPAGRRAVQLPGHDRRPARRADPHRARARSRCATSPASAPRWTRRSLPTTAGRDARPDGRLCNDGGRLAVSCPHGCEDPARPARRGSGRDQGQGEGLFPGAAARRALARTSGASSASTPTTRSSTSRSTTSCTSCSAACRSSRTWTST